MTVDKIILTFFLFATIATLYSAVGHAGASGYLALMAFLGGYIPISPKYFKLIAGLFLVVASFFLLIRTYYKPVQTTTRSMPLAYGLIWGSFIGLISGLKFLLVDFAK